MIGIALPFRHPQTVTPGPSPLHVIAAPPYHHSRPPSPSFPRRREGGFPAHETHRVYKRIQDKMLKRYGGPAKVIEEGAFTAALEDDVRTGAFIRIMEWSMDGGTVRLGVPRRLDRLEHFRTKLTHSDRPFRPMAASSALAVDELRLAALSLP